MKQFVAFVLLFLCLAVVNGQDFASKPVKVQTIENLTVHAVKTGSMYKGLPVYKGTKGGLFVIKTAGPNSKNPGRLYKVYLKAKPAVN